MSIASKAAWTTAETPERNAPPGEEATEEAGRLAFEEFNP
jgi:hypothetical protein